VGKDAIIMFIGEALGFQEERKRRPFIGPAGRFLRENCAIAGITNYYLTNVVKCRADGRPSFVRQDACRDLLMDEIFSLKPKIIVPLGNTALKRILGLSKISKVRGQVIPSNFLSFHFLAIPTYHPSPKNVRVIDWFIADFKVIKRVYEEVKGNE
jgi:DNA polymerase